MNCFGSLITKPRNVFDMEKRGLISAGLLCLLAFILTLAIGLVPSRAQDRPATEALLPETTVLFVQLDNWQDFVDKMQDSSMGKMLSDRDVAPVVDNVWEELKSAYQSELKDEIGFELDDIVSLPHGEITIAVIAPRRKDPEFVFILETDPESEAADRVLNQSRELIEREGGEIEVEENEDGIEIETMYADGTRLRMFRKDGLIVGSTSEEELQHIIDRWMGREVEKVRPLASNRKFITIMNRCRGGQATLPEARIFIDPIELARSATRGDIGSQFVINLLPILGLDGLLGMGGSILLNEDDFASVTHAHVLLAEPRKGIFQMFAFRPTDYRPEAWMPVGASNYFTSSWDLPLMVSELTKIIETFQEEGTVDRFFENNLDTELGFNVREDLIFNLTGRFTFAQWIEGEVALNSQVPIFAFQVRDVELMENCLEKVFERINRDTPEDSPFRWERGSHRGTVIYEMNEEGMAGIQERQFERQNQNREERGQPGYQVRVNANVDRPSFALIDDYLIISPQSPDALRRAIDTNQGQVESLVDSDDFRRVSDKMIKSLGRDMPSGIFYSDPRVAMGWIFDLARDETNMEFLEERRDENEFFSRVKKVLDKDQIPDFRDVERYFQPQGGYMTSDETGLHFLFFELRSDR